MEIIDRRRLLRSGLALGLATAGPMAFWGCVARGEKGQATDRQTGILATVSDLVFPRDDTPAASTLQVPVFVAVALAHGLDGTTQAGANAAIQGAAEIDRHVDGLWVLDAFEEQLDAAAGGNFPGAGSDRQRAVLEALDRRAFNGGGENDPWHKIKDLIVIGYCTSEAGGSRYLQYELVPGRWDPDLLLPADNRAFSSDWTARDFG